MFKNYRLSKEPKITQEKLAEKIDIEVRTYQEIESGRSIPLATTFSKIILSLNLSNEEIMKVIKYYASLDNKKGKKRKI